MTYTVECVIVVQNVEAEIFGLGRELKRQNWVGIKKSINFFLYSIKDGGFYKNSLLSSKKHERIARHVVNSMRGHFNRSVNPTVVRDLEQESV